MIEFGIPKPVEPTQVEVDKPATDSKSQRDVVFMTVILILVAIVGVMLFDRSSSDGGKRDENEQIVDDFDNKSGADAFVLVADRFPPSPEVVDIAEVVKEYAEKIGKDYRWYDDNQSDSKDLVDYAASRKVFPPCVVMVKNGKPIEARDAKDLMKGRDK